MFDHPTRAQNRLHDLAGDATRGNPDLSRPHLKELRGRLEVALAARLSPERTRRPTRLERMTVRRLDWDQVVRANRYLELIGKLCTAVWVGFMASVVLGVEWKELVQDAINSGKPVRGAFVLGILVPTLVFVAARSLVGFSRWRLQRELWRRDVERLGGPDPDS